LRLTIVFVLFAAAFANAAGSGGVNAPEQLDKPYVILISIDGFRWDYQDLAETPALDRIAATGVRAERLLPVFPTLTFPNHYSIATGLYPVHHGIIGNYFPGRDGEGFYAITRRETVQDGSWYLGEPVWVAAEKAGMVTAAYYFVGTEAGIDGVWMSHWRAFDEEVSKAARVDQVLAWLAMPERERPHLVTLYFEHVDDASHANGPGSGEGIAAIEAVDRELGRLLDGIDSSPIADDTYVVVVSDHGQMRIYRSEPPFVVADVVDLDGLRAIDHGSAIFVYFPEPDPGRARAIRDTVNENWDRGKAYLGSELPEAWHVGSDNYFADLILQAEPGHIAFSTRERINTIVRGNHGWAPETPEMHGSFLATGPRLPQGRVIGPVRNVDIYPLLMEILGLDISMPIDGDPDALVPLLQ